MPDGARPTDTELLLDPRAGSAASTLRVGDRRLLALSDGVFVMHPTFLGTPSAPTVAHEVLTAQHGQTMLPLGCFLLPGEKNVLVDCGLGPVRVQGDGLLIGGMLLGALAGCGLRPEDVDILAVSHLHADHIGWIGDRQGRATFPNARILVGQADWDHFVGQGHGAGVIEPHIQEALDLAASQGRLELLDGDAEIVPGIRRLGAPGHTPGHSVYVVHDGGDRVLLFGDALYCPQQLTHLDWEAASDVDPALARRTRETLQRDLELHGGEGLGSHFPELIAGRAISTRDNGSPPDIALY
jgi:glyoxylase-like metal-dependent hydrolase (beta-lactamase superfamily II)